MIRFKAFCFGRRRRVTVLCAEAPFWKNGTAVTKVLKSVNSHDFIAVAFKTGK